jgi:hypothetical protein
MDLNFLLVMVSLPLDYKLLEGKSQISFTFAPKT